MASSNLLKEAIADAKAVRETAIANAKLALEEAFTPKLQSMLSNKIEEELEDDEDTVEEQSDSSTIGKGDNKVDQADGDDEEKSETEKTSAAYGSEDSNLKVVDKLTEAEDEETEVEDEKDEMMKEEDEDDDNVVDINIDADGDDDDDMDMELEAIIKELEAEDEETEMEDEKSEMEDEKDEMMKEEDEETDMEDEKSEEEEEMDEELNIESILNALKEEDEETEEEDEQDEMYKEQLEEAYNTIKSLKSTLNEVNLLNAKLLFSNKLFKNHSMNESQKMKVIENFDRASTIREVKLVYATLSEGFQMTGKTKRTIKESYASKPSRSTAPKKEIISEGTDLTARWKKLANL